MDKTILDEDFIISNSLYLLFTNPLSDLNIGESLLDTILVCEDFILQILFTDDGRNRRLAVID